MCVCVHSLVMKSWLGFLAGASPELTLMRVTLTLMRTRLRKITLMRVRCESSIFKWFTTDLIVVNVPVVSQTRLQAVHLSGLLLNSFPLLLALPPQGLNFSILTLHRAWAGHN